MRATALRLQAGCANCRKGWYGVAEIHRKTTQVVEEGLQNNFRSNFDQFNQHDDNEDEKIIIKGRNYNVDFLLIHLRDTLHCLRDEKPSPVSIQRQRPPETIGSW